MHRNTYLNSPSCWIATTACKAIPASHFAGQMTGVEGYVESCASGFLVGVELARRLKGQAPIDFPQETAIGALGLYISNGTVADFQPMNINFGIIPPLDHRVKGKRNKNAELSQRSLAIIEQIKEEVLSCEDYYRRHGRRQRAPGDRQGRSAPAPASAATSCSPAMRPPSVMPPPGAGVRPAQGVTVHPPPRRWRCATTGHRVPPEEGQLHGRGVDAAP